MKNLRETADKFAAIEALYRYTAGLDLRDNDLLVSAFAADAISDFRSATKKAGFDIPVLKGREVIIATLMSALNQIDITHSVSNPRASIDGDRAVIDALVEAQHLLPAGYMPTVNSSIEIVSRSLNGIFKFGFQSPGSAYGEELLQTLSDIKIIDFEIE